MPQIRISTAADLLGISDDTIRRLIETGVLACTLDHAGRKTVDGAELAEYARDAAKAATDSTGVGSSARNRFVGLVTAVASDEVMSQVEMQCGPFRVVSLMSTEAVRDLGLEPGSLAVAVIKATNVIIEVKRERK